MKFDPIPGCYTTVEYDTGKPYEVDNTLELIDDDDLLGIADSVAEITVTRGQVDKLIEYLKMWRNSKSTSPYDMGGEVERMKTVLECPICGRTVTIKHERKVWFWSPPVKIMELCPECEEADHRKHDLGEKK